MESVKYSGLLVFVHSHSISVLGYNKHQCKSREWWTREWWNCQVPFQSVGLFAQDSQWLQSWQWFALSPSNHVRHVQNRCRTEAMQLWTPTLNRNGTFPLCGHTSLLECCPERWSREMTEMMCRAFSFGSLVCWSTVWEGFSLIAVANLMQTVLV